LFPTSLSGYGFYTPNISVLGISNTGIEDYWRLEVGSDQELGGGFIETVPWAGVKDRLYLQRDGGETFINTTVDSNKALNVGGEAYFIDRVLVNTTTADDSRLRVVGETQGISATATGASGGNPLASVAYIGTASGAGGYFYGLLTGSISHGTGDGQWVAGTSNGVRVFTSGTGINVGKDIFPITGGTTKPNIGINAAGRDTGVSGSVFKAASDMSGTPAQGTVSINPPPSS
ncbi:unnamed protein product, partial [marine sediment metagenome]